jgi:hypothetical protein
MILAVIGLVTGTAVYVRSRFRPLQEASDSQRTIVAAYGAPDVYVPPPDGRIAPERMEAFLSAREALKDAQQHLNAAFEAFDVESLSRRERSFRGVLRIFNDVSNILAPIGEFVKQRNQILTDKGMGLGEYAYIYTVAYHSWLGHRPNEGPLLLERIPFQGGEQTSDDNPGFTPESVQRHYQRLVIRLLENELGGIQAGGQIQWRNALKEEIARLERDPDRVAWQNQLPVQIDGCLKPYRGRLTSTYHPATNYIELLTLTEFNQYRFTGPVEAQR